MSTQCFVVKTKDGKKIRTEWNNEEGLEGEFINGKTVRLKVSLDGAVIFRSISPVDRSTSGSHTISDILGREGFGNYATQWLQKMLRSFETWQKENFPRKNK